MPCMSCMPCMPSLPSSPSITVQMTLHRCIPIPDGIPAAGCPQPSPVSSVSPLAPPQHGPRASPPAQTHSGTPGQVQPAQGHVSSAPLHNTGSQVKLSRAPAHRAVMGGRGGLWGSLQSLGSLLLHQGGRRALEEGGGQTASCSQMDLQLLPAGCSTCPGSVPSSPADLKPHLLDPPQPHSPVPCSPWTWVPVSWISHTSCLPHALGLPQPHHVSASP